MPPYDHLVDVEAKLSKKEVEARLHSASTSITNRLSVIQDELDLSKLTGLKPVLRKPLVRVGIGLAAGLAVGLIAGRSRRGSERRGRALAHRVAEEAARRIEAGQPLESALAEALHSVRGSGRRGSKRRADGLIGIVVGSVVRTGVRAILDEFRGTSGSASKDE